ncbi:MAG: hypothetical protein JWO36_1262 [Myxococcales bacterium]|nr:hypothetical protein [Myxococcales bacterium]
MRWRAIDSDRVRAAIEAAERTTSGEIVVSVSRFFWGNVERAARRAFERIGVANTKQHNGVLLFVVPARRRFVVLGDAGIHDKVGQAFWDTTAAAIRERFRARDFTGGLVRGVEVIGSQLASYFPPTADDVNELPDAPDFA